MRRSEAKPSRAAVSETQPPLRPVSEPGVSRRDALRRGALAAGAIAGTGLLRPALAGAQSPDDEDLRDFLVEAIGLEQITVLAYSRAADTAGNAEQKSRYDDFRDQEQAHANALRSALDELGFDPPEAPGSPTDTTVFDDVEGLDAEAAKRLSDLLDQVGAANNPEQILELLTRLETDQLTYYAGEGPGLDTADLATTVAEIAGCQAQHLFVLGEAAGDSPSDAAAAAARIATEAAPADDSTQ